MTFTATDGELTDSETITITVTDSNRPPVLGVVGDRTVREGMPLAFSLAATDPDADAVTLSVRGLPPGAKFDAPSGSFSWTPGYDRAGDYLVTCRAIDNGTPALFAEETITVHVLSPAGPIFSDDFSDGASPADWLTVSGSWAGDDGGFTAGSTSHGNLVRVLPLDPDVLPVRAGMMQATVRLGVARGPMGPNAMLVFAYRDATHYRWVKLTETGVLIGQNGVLGGVPAGVKKRVSKPHPLGRSVLLTVKVFPDGWVRACEGASMTPVASFRFFAGGKGSVVAGGVGLATSRAKSVFDNVKVWENSALAR